MASIIKIGHKHRAQVRIGGVKRTQTFSTFAAAKVWASRIEGEVEELRASGIMQARGLTLSNLIDRYTEQFYSQKLWGRTKTANLERLKKDLGSINASSLTSARLTEYFQDRFDDGTGGVSISGYIGYLVQVLRVARTLWHLDVPLQAAIDARGALKSVGMVSKSATRDRRVADAELAQLIADCDKHKGSIPLADLLRFSLASGFRISETCNLLWADINEAAKEIMVRDRKHPQEKRGNNSIVPLLNVTGFDAFKVVMAQPKNGARIFPYSAKTISTLITRAAARAGLEDLHLHDLRHEAITRLFAAGLRIEQVSLVSGHRDWKMLKRYIHVAAVDVHRQLAA